MTTYHPALYITYIQLRKVWKMAHAIEWLNTHDIANAANAPRSVVMMHPHGNLIVIGLGGTSVI